MVDFHRVPGILLPPGDANTSLRFLKLRLGRDEESLV